MIAYNCSSIPHGKAVKIVHDKMQHEILTTDWASNLNPLLSAQQRAPNKIHMPCQGPLLAKIPLHPYYFTNHRSTPHSWNRLKDSETISNILISTQIYCSYSKQLMWLSKLFAVILNSLLENDFSSVRWIKMCQTGKQLTIPIKGWPSERNSYSKFFW